MKRLLTISTILFATAMFASCGVSWSNVAYHDDLYEIHDKIKIEKERQARAELAQAKAEAAQAEYNALMAQIQTSATQSGDASINGFDAVLADDYASAYARRLYGFSSPTYRMPSSYYDYRYSDAFFYASAYDPAFYNVMVSGDMVWVEPKYVTSMFGSWGAVAVPSYSWYYGWGSPYSSLWWGNPYRYGWNNYWYSGYYNPYYWGYPYYPHYHRPHRPPHHKPHHGGVGGTGHSRYDFDRVRRNPNASTPAARGGSSSYRPGTSYRGSTPSSGSSYRSKGTPSSSRGSSGSSYRSSGNSGSSTYRSGSSSSSSSSYRSGSSSGNSSYRSSGSSRSSSYRSSGSSSGSGYSGGGGGSSRSGGSTYGR